MPLLPTTARNGSSSTRSFGTCARLQVVIVEAIGGALCGAGGLLAYGVRGRSAAFFGPSVYQGDKGRPSIALTFDDGPSQYTPALLEVLDRYKAPATFFQCGVHVERFPDVARNVSRAGHDIGNHTFSHQALWLRSARFIEEEVSLAQNALERVHGFPPRLFRAPYGARWFGLNRVQRRLNLLGVMWTTIALDWRLSANRIYLRLLRSAHNGAIFCMHDGRGARPDPDVRETVDAVRRLVPALLDRGFHFETVSQIICPTN
jgi:peptidoglycan-N-acetylglucosamine deacetylase